VVSFALHGIGVSGGIAIGRAQLVSHATREVAHYTIPLAQVPSEIARFSAAIGEVKQELEGLHAALTSGDAPGEFGAFLDVHWMILNDPTLSEAPKRIIAEQRCNAEWALTLQMGVLVEQFDQIEDSYLRERKGDVADLVGRLRMNLRKDVATPRDLLREAGMEDDPAKIPLKWDDYWSFWKKAQEALRKKDPAKYGKLYGIGMTESTRASDTMYNFEMALLSFNGEILDKGGKIVADQPKNKKAIVDTLKFFGDLFTSGYVPPDATNWTDGDNNAGFHSRTLVMTPNPSQSIPAAQFFNKDDAEKKNYFDNMATIEWPDGPDGKKARYLSAVKTIIVPKDSKNQAKAKDFIKFVVEKDRFFEYIKAANGRWFPAFTDVAADSFWKEGHKGPKGQKDLHVPVATKIFLERDNKVFEHYKHPALSQVYDEFAYAKAISRIITDKWPAEKAADEMIERMKAIFAQYK